jgi:hypothetical protein
VLAYFFLRFDFPATLRAIAIACLRGCFFISVLMLLLIAFWLDPFLSGNGSSFLHLVTCVPGARIEIGSRASEYEFSGAQLSSGAGRAYLRSYAGS